MERELTIKQLIKRTYLKIIWQFLLCLILFYIVPALLSSVSGINEKNANRFIFQRQFLDLSLYHFNFYHCNEY